MKLTIIYETRGGDRVPMVFDLPDSGILQVDPNVVCQRILRVQAQGTMPPPEQECRHLLPDDGSMPWHAFVWEQVEGRNIWNPLEPKCSLCGISIGELLFPELFESKEDEQDGEVRPDEAEPAGDGGGDEELATLLREGRWEEVYRRFPELERSIGPAADRRRAEDQRVPEDRGSGPEPTPERGGGGTGSERSGQELPDRGHGDDTWRG